MEDKKEGNNYTTDDDTGVSNDRASCQINSFGPESFSKYLDCPNTMKPRKENTPEKGVYIKKEEMDTYLPEDFDAKSGSSSDQLVACHARPSNILSPQEECIEGQNFSDNPDDMRQIQCNICFKNNFKSLRQHVRKIHNMSMKEFRQLHSEILYHQVTYHRYDQLLKFNLLIKVQFLHLCGTILSGFISNIIHLFITSLF